MELKEVLSLTSQLIDSLLGAGVTVVYSDEMPEDYLGEYDDEKKAIIINDTVSEEEILTTLTHETIHFLQFNAGWLIGKEINNPNLSEEDNRFVETLVAESYEEDCWDIEFPAWKLETFPSFVLEKLENYNNYVVAA